MIESVTAWCLKRNIERFFFLVMGLLFFFISLHIIYLVAWKNDLVRSVSTSLEEGH